MKRWMSFFAALFLTCSVIGCGGVDSGTVGDENDPETTTDAEQMEEETMDEDGGDEGDGDDGADGV